MLKRVLLQAHIIGQIEWDSDLDFASGRLGYKLIDRIDEYFSGLIQRPVQLPEELRTFPDLAKPLPEFGKDAVPIL